MIDSRMRILTALRAGTGRQRMFAAAPLAAVLSVATPQAQAQQSDSAVLESIIVTAQKRQENLQDVPLSITALGTARFDFQLCFTGFINRNQPVDSRFTVRFYFDRSWHACHRLTVDDQTRDRQAFSS